MSQLVSPAPGASRGGPVPVPPARCHCQLCPWVMDGLSKTGAGHAGRSLSTPQGVSGVGLGWGWTLGDKVTRAWVTR